ncbi:MAG: DUF4145 domain-containing protein [Limnoraphis sp.]
MKSIPKSIVDSVNATERCNCGMQMRKCIHKFQFFQDDLVYDDVRTDHVVKIFQCDNCFSPTIVLYSYTRSEEYLEFLGIDNISQREFDEQAAMCESCDYPDELFNPPYTKRVLYEPKIKKHKAISPAIIDILNQANSIKSESPRACFILCRAVLEEVCDDFNIDRTALNNKGKEYFIQLINRLEQLCENEKLSEDLKTIVQSLRRLGNEGAHSKHREFQEKVTDKDAEFMIELTDYILGRLYVDRYEDTKAQETLESLLKKVLTDKVEDSENQGKE